LSSFVPADRSPEIEKAAAILRRGGLVAFPTETVYGLGADATSDNAVAGIYAAKQRPSFNPLIAHVASLEEARQHGLFSETALLLARQFWPGPLTLVVPAAPQGKICSLARAGLDSVALRVPAHPLARALIEATGLPLAAPSANRSGRVSPVTAEQVREDLGDRVDFILDGGPCPIGLESTIIDCLGDVPRLLRPGGISRQTIEDCLGNCPGKSLSQSSAVSPLSVSQAEPLRAPGLLTSHYAPRAAVRLEATSVHEDEAGLDFGGTFGRQAGANCLDLSPGGDLREAAAHLFTYLRQLDRLGLPRIAVAPIPENGLGEAINDRLRRAAAPRAPQADG